MNYSIFSPPLTKEHLILNGWNLTFEREETAIYHKYDYELRYDNTILGEIVIRSISDPYDKVYFTGYLQTEQDLRSIEYLIRIKIIPRPIAEIE